MASAKTKKKSANQLYAEKYLENLTTEWFDGYHNFVFIIRIDGESKFNSSDAEVAWSEAADYARKRVEEIRQRREELKVIKSLRAFLPSVNACLSPKEKKAVARAIERLEAGIEETKKGIRIK